VQFRPALLSEIVVIAAMVRRFYQRDGKIYGIPYDQESCLESIADVMERGVVIRGPMSCGGAYLIPWPFQRSITVAQVFFWCFDDSKEIGIYDALARACMDKGATHINVASLAPKHSGKQFYERRGLKLAEGQYLGPIKVLHGA
jgi:hypothetical protein